ncbi:MAG: FAD-dependent oxidoreductase [Bacillota bacterium]
MGKNYEVLIIGGGPAGISISKIFGKASEKIRAAVFRPEPHSLIYCALPYVIEQVVPLEKTFKNDSLVTDNGVELIHDEVTKVDLVNHQVWTKSGDKYSYQKLVIATGAHPVLPPIAGVDLKGVMTFKTEFDLAQILSSVQKGLKKAVVVGAGAIGIELAQALNSQGVEVHLVDMQNSILPSLADAEMVADPQKALAGEGINLHLSNKVVSIAGKEAVEKVKLEDGDEINFSLDEEALVVFSVGMKAEMELFKDSKLALGKNGILVNARMETNLPGVYAAGDCVEYTSAITGDIIEGKLATNAVPMAKIAARNILGGNVEYDGFYNGGATKIYDFYIGGTGFTEKAALTMGFSPVVGYGNTTTKFPIMPGTKKMKVKLIADAKTRRLIGGQVVSAEPVTDRIDVLTFALQKQSLIEDLAALSYSSQPYQSFYPANSAIVMAAEEIIDKLRSLDSDLDQLEVS